MFKVTFYKTQDGIEPAAEFIQSLEPKAIEKVRRGIELLKQFGTALREPNTKKLRKEIFELRVRHSPNAYRFLYFFVVGNEIIITHGFQKTTDKTPDNEIDKALRYKEDYETQQKKS